MLIDHLNPLMDLIKVELSIMIRLCARGLDRIVPHVGLLGSEQQYGAATGSIIADPNDGHALMPQ